MKNKLQLFSVYIILSAIIFPQTVSDFVTISDLVGGSKNLFFGLDSAATDGIDSLFGEYNLPPIPPAGIFEARFFLPENNFIGTLSSYKDIRNAPSFPFCGQKEFRLVYQVGVGGTVIKIDWNFPQDVSGLLQDMFGGVIINVLMTGANSYTVTIPGVLYNLKMLIDYNCTVPVELVSLSASVIGHSVHLNWSTSTETNNSGFEVYRKTENTEWQKIGFVEGVGTSTNINEYIYTDKLPTTSGKFYYRLRQVDFDGKSNYSTVVSAYIIAPFEFKLSQNYPNPFNPSTVINYQLPVAGEVTLKVYDMLGREIATLVDEYQPAGNYEVKFQSSVDSRQLASGVYYYQLKVNNFIQTRKMVFLK